MNLDTADTQLFDISFVIPVYNGAATITQVVQEIRNQFLSIRHEIILVNDGSQDNTEAVCHSLVCSMHSDAPISFVQLSKNFSEHNAVLAGLSKARGEYVAVLDDDGQNPPSQVWPMYRAIQKDKLDCVYGYYIEKQHSWFRNLGSRFNDWVATRMLGKPKHIYLSSFKVMNRFVVNQVLQYKGAFPYIDGLIFRVTSKISQVPVVHAPRLEGKSGYNLQKLVSLWLNMFLNFSIGPLRVAVILGLLTSAASVPLVFIIIIDKLHNPNLTVGVPSILVTITFFAGIQLLNMGLIGEYLGRIFLDQSGRPQFVVRYVLQSNASHQVSNFMLSSESSRILSDRDQNKQSLNSSGA